MFVLSQALFEKVEREREKTRQLREKRREEGRREALEEIRTALRAWHERRKAAEKEGKEFDEPIPFLEDGSPD